MCELFVAILTIVIALVTIFQFRLFSRIVDCVKGDNKKENYIAYNLMLYTFVLLFLNFLFAMFFHIILE